LVSFACRCKARKPVLTHVSIRMLTYADVC
jgi:hypothetical protein